MTDDEVKGWLGKSVRQVKASPDYLHLIGRESAIDNVFVDEKWNGHARTADGYWCPIALLEQLP